MRALLPVLALGVALLAASSPALAADKAWETCAGSDDDKAIVGCTQVLARGNRESKSNQAIANYNRGVSYRNKGDNEKALADYERALKLNPKYANAYNGRANIKAELGDLDGALSDYNRALKFEPKNARFLRNRGLTFVQKGSLSAALADYDRAIPLDRKNELLYYNRGQVYEKQGLVTSAEADFRKSLEIKPDFADADTALKRVTGGGQATATASSDPDWEACAGADDDKSIAGCANVLARGDKETTGTRASAHYNRGVSYRNKSDDEKALADYEAALALNPQYASPYNGRGNIKADRNDLDGALADYNEALRLDPRNAQFLRNRGLTLFKKGDYAAARADYDLSIESDAKNAFTWYNRAETLEKLGEKDLALADYRKALEVDPGHESSKSALQRLEGGATQQAAADGPAATPLAEGGTPGSSDKDWDDCASQVPETSIAGCTAVLGRGERETAQNRALAYRNRAISYFPRREFDRALADLDESLRLEPDNAASIETRGEVFARQGRCDKAVDDFAQAMQINAKAPSPYVNRSDCRRVRKDFDGAVADANQALALDPKNAGAYAALGYVYSDRNEFDRAISAFDTAIGFVSNRSDLYVSRGNVQLFRGRLDEAFADYDKAASLDPQSVDAFNGRGVVENFRGEHDAAIADFNKAIELTPTMSMIYVNRGELLLDMGRRAEALPDLDKAIALDNETISTTAKTDPNGFNALLDRAYAKVLKGDLDGGIADANQALAIDPRSKEALDTRGLAYAGKKNFARAIADLSQGIAIGGYVTQIYRHRAETYEAAGSHELASEDYEAVLRLAPGHAIAKEGLARARQAMTSGPAVADSTAAPESDVPVKKVVKEVALGKRVALIIGNSAYEKVAQLPNPKRDAAKLASSLQAVGFSKVTVVEDLTSSGFNDTLRAFSRDADGADWAMIYYAGHGMEMNNSNYLVPVDAQLQTDRDVQFEAVPLERVVASIEGAKGMRLVILDACRDNPFTAAMKRTSATRSIGRGLALVEPEGGTLVAYAAKAGQVAQDGDGENSPFVTALVKRIETPGIEIGKLFRLVRDDVLGATGRQQEPFVYGSLPSEDMFINPSRD
jgi:tetratricopeptide (TPR) repeat protein